MKQRLAFLGLGTMGQSMVKNLLKGGYEVVVWNRTISRAEAMQADGAIVARSPKEAASGASCVFTCVTNGAALLEVIQGSEGILSADVTPEVVVDHSTIAPAEARAAAKILSAQDIEFLDAPVTGGDVGARNGTLTIMVGGDPALSEKLKPIFSAMGKKIIHLGPVGSGQLGKCVNQIAVAGAVTAMSEALAFAEGAGLDLEKTFDILRGGAAGSWALENYGPRLMKGDYAPGFLAEHMLKDLKIALEEGKRFGESLPMTTVLEKLYAKLCEIAPPGTVGNHGLPLLYRKNRGTH